MIELLLAFIVGATLASNNSIVYRFFSLRELIKGISKGLTIGEDWKRRGKR